MIDILVRFSDSVRIEQPYRTKDQNWVGSWRRWNLELGDDRLKFGRHPIELKDIYLAQLLIMALPRQPHCYQPMWMTDRAFIPGEWIAE